MLYDACKADFQRLLLQSGVSEDTVLALEYRASVFTANQFLASNAGATGKAIVDKDHAAISLHVTRLLNVGCAPFPMQPADRDALCIVAVVMPAMGARENEQVLNSLNSVASHMSQQFPVDCTSGDAKIDYSVNYMIVQYESQHPGVIRPSMRFKNSLLDPCLQFALHKCGLGSQSFALSKALPNFTKIALKAGHTEEAVGDKLFQKKEGEEIEPHSIGAVNKYFSAWLTQVQAMMQIKMPDGTMYGTEAGFAILLDCMNDYAITRPTVANICSALTKGWQRFTDDLTLSQESFTDVCRKAHVADYWVEDNAATPKRNVVDGSREVQSLKSQLVNERAKVARLTGNARHQNFSGSGNNFNHFNDDRMTDHRMSNGMVRSTKPCFDFFAGKRCARNPCPFRHDGEPPNYNPARNGGGGKGGGPPGQRR